jgi:hypothetical protein
VHEVRKIASILVALVLAFGFSLLTALPVSIYAAPPLANVTNTPTDTTAGATTTDNVSFVTASQLEVAPSAAQIIITFPAGFDASAATVNATATHTPSGSPPTVVSHTATVVTCNVTAVEPIGAFNIVLDNIVNHQTADAYTVAVQTQRGDGIALQGGLSAPFDITAGAASQLVITQQPAGSVSGVALTTQPGVEARDAFGNRDTTYTTNITAATDEPGTLGGTLSVTPVAGIATFTDLVYTATADHEIFQIDFTSPGLTPATSNGVNCNVVATKLVFTQQPAGSVSGVALTTQPIVAAQDANNVTDTDYVTNVTAAENDPGTLTGTLIVAPAAGVATFTDLVYTAAAPPETFQIDVTSPGITGATSNDVVCTAPGGGGGIPSPSGSGSMNLAPYLNWEGRAIINMTLTSTNGLVTMGIPSGTLLLDAQGNRLGNIQIVTLSTPPPPPGYVLVGHAYDCLPDGATFQPAITMTFKYAEADIPEGVSEEDLVLAYWDGGQWVNLTTTVSAINNTATAQVAHFTPFAILAYTGAPAFAASDLSITPAEVDIGEEVTISLLVANSGDAAGSYEVTLKIDDAAVATEAVTLAAGASETVIFTTAKDVAGTYAVSAGGLSGTFTVKEAAPPPGEAPPEAEEAKPLNPWVVVLIVAVVIAVVLVAVMLARRRRA